ncbi:hemolysin secretion protein D [Brevundimonas sp. EAKA]|nr:HlyD family secretion protein [Brevundimonas sp. EAKA]KDP95360.1 hemolysin secretion protein D [Brevundimonas sp. EAKA]
MTDTTSPQSAQPAPPPPASPPEPDKRVLWAVIAAVVAVFAVGLVLYAWQLPPFTGHVQRTDNAYVRGQVTIISPQVSGYVVQVPVQDFQAVQQGQLLAQVDDRTYRQKLEQAEAALHSAQAALSNSTQSQASARGAVAQQRAGIAAAQAALTRAQADADRARTLKAGGWVSQSNVDIAVAALRSAQAQLAQAQAGEGVAQTGVTSAVVNRDSLAAAVENAQAAVRLAQIDLANTRITAPRPGRLGEVGVRQGQYVTAGTQLMGLVPDVVWVTANMKETQMRDIRIGQPVEIAVDSLGGRTLRGRVERIAPAAGSEFSVIRPDNATGNFTKVAQRIPVRIRIEPGQAGVERLAPGMSVVAKVDTGG